MKSNDQRLSIRAILEGGLIDHALNRGNPRQPVFHKSQDDDTLLRVLGEGMDRYPVESFLFTLTPHHWQRVLRPLANGLLGWMLRWVKVWVYSAGNQ